MTERSSIYEDEVPAFDGRRNMLTESRLVNGQVRHWIEEYRHQRDWRQEMSAAIKLKRQPPSQVSGRSFGVKSSYSRRYDSGYQ